MPSRYAEPRITHVSDLARFLEARIPNNKCPHCGHDKFLVETEPDEETVSVFLIDARADPAMRGTPASGALEAFSYSCLNCYSLFHILSVPVWIWLDENRSE